MLSLPLPSKTTVLQQRKTIVFASPLLTTQPLTTVLISVRQRFFTVVVMIFLVVMGFSMSWIDKVIRCVHTVKYSFALNGEIIGKVNPGKGLRQGDPLSLYLFVICAQGLSSLFYAHEARNLFSGVRIASSCPSISHLFFAEDSLIFFRAIVNDCEGIRNCLSLYERALGQLISYEKSALSFSPNTKEETANSIKTMLSISIMQGHEIYLGLPTLSLRSKNLQFRYLIE